MRWPSFTDKQVYNIQVVVMHCNMQWCQTILQKQNQNVIQFRSNKTLFIFSLKTIGPFMFYLPSQRHLGWHLSPATALLHPPFHTLRPHEAEWSLSTVHNEEGVTLSGWGTQIFGPIVSAQRLQQTITKGEHGGFTLVILVCCASMSNRIRTVCAWPSRAAMCSGVCPAVVVELGLALWSSSSFTNSLWPIRAAQWRGVWSSWPGRGEWLWMPFSSDYQLLHYDITQLEKW